MSFPLPTPREQLARLTVHTAYVEALTAATAPVFTIDADPDGPDEPIELTFINDESLERVKAVLLAEMRRTAQLLEAQIAAAGSASTELSAPSYS
ncbi:hypothetical protein MON38_10630 [Hymenobacter sp. DH14]|uniref:Uncharacterized protein n=1 Tax=Hymenobacter cyanobacteriorum TaxID=2926463 RepID=A0A9X1VFB0_9BACT|nr:hypothetical protein [Hymenobacter cyanobacteriorum]MCI1187876.1 hypothetical protein [Hymenobacter cyanobacteriorum]